MPAFKKGRLIGKRGKEMERKKKKKAVKNNVSGYGYRTDER